MSTELPDTILAAFNVLFDEKVDAAARLELYGVVVMAHITAEATARADVGIPGSPLMPKNLWARLDRAIPGIPHSSVHEAIALAGYELMVEVTEYLPAGERVTVEVVRRTMTAILTRTLDSLPKGSPS